jgi:hypothetical protein
MNLNHLLGAATAVILGRIARTKSPVSADQNNLGRPAAAYGWRERRDECLPAQPRQPVQVFND